jgi:hypothetical protein
VIEGLKTNVADGYLPVLVITAQPGHKLRGVAGWRAGFHQQAVRSARSQDAHPQQCWRCGLLYKKLEKNNRTLEQTVLERTAELRESEARYRSLTELASDWYWEQDEHGAFTKVSGPVPGNARHPGPRAGGGCRRDACERLERGGARSPAGDDFIPAALPRFRVQTG